MWLELKDKCQEIQVCINIFVSLRNEALNEKMKTNVSDSDLTEILAEYPKPHNNKGHLGCSNC